jgi:hypothetical protein
MNAEQQPACENSETRVLAEAETDDIGYLCFIRWPEGVLARAGGVIVWRSWEPPPTRHLQVAAIQKEHAQRVADLLAANNAEVERRRTAERRLAATEQALGLALELLQLLQERPRAAA